MNTKHATGTSTTRRMREACSSLFRRGTRPTLADRIANYSTLQPRALRSRCVVRTSSGSEGTHGATRITPIAEYAWYGWVDPLTAYVESSRSPKAWWAVSLWCDWTWR